MKLNIFLVPQDNVGKMKAKFQSVGLDAIDRREQGGWMATFHFSESQQPAAIPWVETFAEVFNGRTPRNLIHFGAYVFERAARCYVLTFGKSHFYVRQFCDHDFGVEMAKRIGDEHDIRITGSKRFAGTRKKEVKSFAARTMLNVESGESVDYLRIAISSHLRMKFGRTGKFGSSLFVNAPVETNEITDLLDHIEELRHNDPLFALPRTTRVSDEAEVARYDQKLLESIVEGRDAEFTNVSHEVVGVDFVFSGNERYTLQSGRHSQMSVGEELDLDALRSFISNERLSGPAILDIRILVENEGQAPYTKSLKESLDFIVEGENVMLSQGHWLRFNEDFVAQLNSSVDSIDLEAVEQDLKVIYAGEPDFNKSDDLRALGYHPADRDFSKIGTSAATPIEAWDLKKGSTVYAVKFGTPQKVGYVCDQAMLVLEIVRNNANVRKLDPDWKSYCLWFGFKNKRPFERISECESLILKQKIDAWSRKCRELRVEPKLKLSLRAE